MLTFSFFFLQLSYHPSSDIVQGEILLIDASHVGSLRKCRGNEGAKQSPAVLCDVNKAER